MAVSYSISSAEIREVGETLFGSAWRGEMAKAVGVPRQSVSYYMKTGGANGAQASAIIGVVARVVVRELSDAKEQQDAIAARQEDLFALLKRFDGR